MRIHLPGGGNPLRATERARSALVERLSLAPGSLGCRHWRKLAQSAVSIVTCARQLKFAGTRRAVSRFLYLFYEAAAIPLGRPLLSGSSDLPGSQTERAAPPPLFGLAPRGACPASRIAPAAVRSYRTFSPLPYAGLRRARRFVFCGAFRETRFERIPPAVSRHAALWRPDFPPVAGRLPARRVRFNYRTARPDIIAS